MSEILYGVLVAPFRDMAGSPAFLAEVVLGGVFAGLLYSLVALGFLLVRPQGLFGEKIIERV